MALKKTEQLPSYLGGYDYGGGNLGSFPAFMPGMKSALANQLAQGFGAGQMRTSFGLDINAANGQPMGGAPANIGMSYTSNPYTQPLVSQNPGGLDPNIVGPGTPGGGPMVIGTPGPIGSSGPGNFPNGVRPTSPATPTGVLPRPPVLTPAVPKQVLSGSTPADYVKHLDQVTKSINGPSKPAAATVKPTSPVTPARSKNPYHPNSAAYARFENEHNRAANGYTMALPIGANQEWVREENASRAAAVKAKGK